MKKRDKFWVVLFDGVCNLCNSTVDWMMRHDPQHEILFVPYQSPAGERVVSIFSLQDKQSETFTLIHKDQLFFRSTAVLKIVSRRGFWKFLKVLFIFPQFFRDAVYGVIARNRYRIFGKKDSCRLPTAAEKLQFMWTVEDLEARGVEMSALERMRT